jgi:hypothetical protein
MPNAVVDAALMIQGLESHQYAVPMRWLGLFRSDIERLSLHSSAIPMSARDVRVAQCMLQWPFFQANEQYRLVLHEMHTSDSKFEIEAIHANASTTLTSFVCQKILQRAYL